MRNLLIISLLALCATSAGAQTPEWWGEPVADSLPEWTMPSAPVEVVEHGDAAATVAALREASRQGRVRGYRVRIFFDNTQSARSQAAAALTQFRELFPETAAYMVYENPYFKVSVGDCVSIEEAIVLRAHIEGNFPKAFISSETIPLANLAQ